MLELSIPALVGYLHLKSKRMEQVSFNPKKYNIGDVILGIIPVKESYFDGGQVQYPSNYIMPANCLEV